MEFEIYFVLLRKNKDVMIAFSEDRMDETRRRGRIEVICGSMFSGKTEELIRRMKRAQFARQKVEIFKPAIDTRYSEEDVVSHEGNSIASTPLDNAASILLLSSDIEVVGIDEAQFFDKGLVDVCNELANRGIRVIIAGLDMDFKGIPFGWHFIRFWQGVMPYHPFNFIFGKICGLFTVMDHFTGRQKK